MYVGEWICICGFEICVWMYLCVCVCLYVRQYASLCMHTCMRMYAHVCACMHVYIVFTTGLCVYVYVGIEAHAVASRCLYYRAVYIPLLIRDPNTMDPLPSKFGNVCRVTLTIECVLLL